MEKLFETATREKYRFPYKGMVSVEDLWDLTPRNLDTVFRALSADVKAAQEESLLAAKSAADTALETKLSIVKYIFEVKLAEIEKAKLTKENREKKQKLLGLIAEKQDAELHDKSVAELQSMLDALE